MKKLYKLFLAAVACACACTPQGQQITGTSEQGNAKFTATIYTETGAAAAGCKVTLRRSDYVTKPVLGLGKIDIESAQTLTNASGFLYIDSLDTGAYSVEISDGKAYAGLLKFLVLPSRDPINWGADTIRRFAIVRGAIDSAATQAKRFVQVYGLERLDTIAPTGKFTLSDLPQGTYRIRVISADSSAGLPVFDRVIAKAGQSTTISPYEAWNNRTSISFNTTATGANVQVDVPEFPALIRLSNGNFNFADAQTDGKDLRFAKSDGTPLPCEVERWDPVAERAEVWVKIDTVLGNSSNQSIIMYWGNPVAPPQAEAAGVFDTVNGFQGVWHLGDNADTVHDATANRFHGIRHGDLSRFSGIIGSGQRFGKNEAYIDMGNVLNQGTSSFTASAWVKRAATGLQTIFAKSNGGSPNASYGWTLSLGQQDQLHGFIANGGSAWGSSGAFDFWSAADAPVTDTTTWHYVVAVVDRSNGKNCKTYIDGIDMTENANGDMAAIGTLINALPLRIGAEADGNYQWTGLMDECVISSTVRSEAWIRLCYMNQGASDRLVYIK
jgi:hypothetical protein